MLSDVVQEAETLLAQDRALKRCPSIVEAIRRSMPAGKSDESDSPQPKLSRIALENFTSLISHAEKEYLGLCEKSLLSHFNEDGSLVYFEEAIEQLASHARSLGWSDEGLVTLMHNTVSNCPDAEDQIRTLCTFLRNPPTKYQCDVAVILCEPSTPEVFNQPHHGVICSKSGSGAKLSIEVVATDPWTAAENAYYRAGTIVGAPNVFQKESNLLSESRVLVVCPGVNMPINIENRIVRDHHNPWKRQIEKIASLAIDSENESTLYEAIRNHHRALNASDVQTAYTLLWAGIERICANPKRMEPILTSTANLVSAAMALSKIRREVQNFAEALTQHLMAKKATSGVGLVHISDDVVRMYTTWYPMLPYLQR